MGLQTQVQVNASSPRGCSRHASHGIEAAWGLPTPCQLACKGLTCVVVAAGGHRSGPAHNLCSASLLRRQALGCGHQAGGAGGAKLLLLLSWRHAAGDEASQGGGGGVVKGDGGGELHPKSRLHGVAELNQPCKAPVGGGGGHAGWLWLGVGQVQATFVAASQQGMPCCCRGSQCPDAPLRSCLWSPGRPP